MLPHPVASPQAWNGGEHVHRGIVQNRQGEVLGLAQEPAERGPWAEGGSVGSKGTPGLDSHGCPSAGTPAQTRRGSVTTVPTLLSLPQRHLPFQEELEFSHTSTCF